MRTLGRLFPTALFAALALLAACGDDEPAGPPDGPTGPTCTSVAWDSLLTVDAAQLSTYGLFVSPTDPTTGAADTGLPYELTTALFTDYASKYRFVFVPCDSVAVYDDREAFDFPVGTVLAKTFAMPADTAVRGPGNETIIETRLLIRRAAGWVALPYVWRDDMSDADLVTTGAGRPISFVHDGTGRNFTYRVPTQAECAGCHTLGGEMSPIGPKARSLNRDLDYGEGPLNQLTAWTGRGLLVGAPADPAAAPATPSFGDDLDLATLDTETERDRYAKAYLDINCAHCHRPDGAYGDRTPYYEYWRPFDPDTATDDHGLCRVIQPGNPNASGLHVMMNIGLMPKIGTELKHTEGLALIDHWIAGMSHTCP
ncbi:hypothetical protein KDM41_14020 [bacterium]|nr:hypothetical protein [bacterium]